MKQLKQLKRHELVCQLKLIGNNYIFYEPETRLKYAAEILSTYKMSCIMNNYYIIITFDMCVQCVEIYYYFLQA